MKNRAGIATPGDMRSEAALAISPRARRAFSALALGSVGLAVLLPALATGYWLIDPPPVARDVGMRMVAIATALLHLLPLSWGLWRLRVCLAQFAAGRPFGPEGIAGLRDFALGTGLCAVTKPLAGLLFKLALGWNGGPKQIAIEISSDVMILALFAGVVAALAWALEKAAALAEENRQFV